MLRTSGCRFPAAPPQPRSRLKIVAAMPNGSRRPLMWAAHVAICALSGVVAFLLRFDFHLSPYNLGLLLSALPLWIAAKSAAFRWLDLDRGWWRHTSVAEVLRCGLANLAGSVAGAALILLFAPANFPRSIYLLDLLVCMHASFAIRLCVRVAGEAVEAHSDAPAAGRVLIYGAGSAGAMLVRELKRNSELRLDVTGFLDDNPWKAGLIIHGVPVLGAGEALPRLIAKHAVTEVLIAIPSAGRREMSRIVEACRDAGVRFRTVPGLGEIVRGAALPSQIRDVAVEDLLGRSAVDLDSEDVRERLEGEVVLITGAAGSIGSELCRQVARVRPRAIVAFDAGETPLFHIAAEMRELFPDVPFYPEVGNIQNRARLKDLFATYAPSVVYHAAAYKHVPLMELNMFEAVENNVLGTFTLALAAADHGVDTFVMISSDKAVRPTNVMGATKRVAELLIRSLQNRRTQFVSVRFGNVLGSQGSVVPLFKKQIAAGAPVTVTHPEMRRYFMTIPEAVQLVLQASTMGNGGEIFVLDMGEPVKIVDLARNLILLSGLRPEIDIPIVFTGIRPGEKLYEELSTFEEHTLPTCHEKIKIFAGRENLDSLTSRMNALRELCARRDRRGLVQELREIVPEYTPSAQALADVAGIATRCEVAA